MGVLLWTARKDVRENPYRLLPSFVFSQALVEYERCELNGELNVVYNRLPITTIATELRKEGNTKWQRQWESTDKGALCRSLFPTVE